MRIDAYVDERRDPVRSSRAAARYLRDLYGKFGNWHVSLGAYNLGPARMARLLRPRAHQARAQAVGQGALPVEARNYVSQFVAALQIARAPQRHGFEGSALVPARYDIVRVRRSLSLRAVASMAGASVAEIAELNPALIQRITPPGGRGYPMRVPRGAKARFEVAYARTAPGAPVEAAPRNLAIVAPAASPVRSVDPPARIALR